MEIRLFRGLSKCPANRNIIFRLYRFSFSLTYKILTCERTLISALHTLRKHHKICNLCCGTHGYGISAYIGFCCSYSGLTDFIDTIPRLLYTKPTSKSQTNNSYDYEAFISVIILNNVSVCRFKT